MDRWFDEWGELLGLGEMRRGPYLTSSALFMDRATAEELLPLVARAPGAASTSSAPGSAPAPRADPLYFLDQDVINAVAPLAARAGAGRASTTRGSRRSRPSPGVRLADADALRCRYGDGAEPFLLHHASRKPWLVRMRANVYSRLLTRLLLGDDVALRLDPERAAAAASRRRRGDGAARLATDVGIGARGVRAPEALPAPDPRAWRDAR